MTGTDALITTIGKFVDLGIPIAILVFLGWLAIKYTPSLIKAANNLGDSMQANTAATCELKNVFTLQGDQLKSVTEKLQGAVDSLARCEARQVKMEDFNKLFILVSTMQNKLNELHVEMVDHTKRHEEETKC